MQWEARSDVLAARGAAVCPVEKSRRPFVSQLSGDSKLEYSLSQQNNLLKTEFLYTLTESW